MSYSYDYEAEDYGDVFAADAASSERMAFIRRTYMHLFGSLLVFMGLCYILTTVLPLRNAVFGLLGAFWWVSLLLFVGAALMAHYLAHSNAPPHVQYLGLGMYTVLQAVFTTPLLIYANLLAGPDAVPTAAFLTMLIFGGLTGFVFITKKDFSFLGGALCLATLGLIGFAVMGAIMGFSMGIAFSALGVVVFSGWILYDTSNLLHHYRTDQHVGAALELFASVVILFKHILYLLIILTGND